MTIVIASLYTGTQQQALLVEIVLEFLKIRRRNGIIWLQLCRGL